MREIGQFLLPGIGAGIYVLRVVYNRIAKRLGRVTPPECTFYLRLAQSPATFKIDFDELLSYLAQSPYEYSVYLATFRRVFAVKTDPPVSLTTWYSSQQNSNSDLPILFLECTLPLFGKVTAQWGVLTQLSLLGNSRRPSDYGQAGMWVTNLFSLPFTTSVLTVHADYSPPTQDSRIPYFVSFPEHVVQDYADFHIYEIVVKLLCEQGQLEFLDFNILDENGAMGGISYKGECLIVPYLERHHFVVRYHGAEYIAYSVGEVARLLSTLDYLTSGR